jgi:hypothetical protein
MTENRKADLILNNARILTLNPEMSFAKSIAMGNGRILAVSRSDNLNSYKGNHTQIIDCHGYTVTPGFNDAHCHPIGYIEGLVTLDVSRMSVSSIADIKAKIKQVAKSTPAGNWIRARGYEVFYLAEKHSPTRWDLDEVAGDHPVKLSHRTGHAHVLNSAAMAIAGIHNDTPEPPGAMIERDLETGEPNGVLYGMAPYLAKVIPELGRDEMDRGIQLASEQFISLGITSVQDASVSGNVKRWKMFQEWKERGYFRPRVSMMMGEMHFDEFCEGGFTPRMGDEWLRLGGVKIILRETTGELHPPQDVLNELISKIHRTGHQAVLHVVEESMLRSACLAFDYALDAYFDKGHRHRLEHCSVCSPAMVEHLISLKTVIVTQPSFIYYNGERYLSMVDEYQLRHLYPIGRLMKAGLKVAAGSDCPVVPLSPVVGIYAAVSRLSEGGISILPEECISPIDALSMYTTNAAYACFDEEVKGSLVQGKLADLVVLSNDPTQIPTAEIKELEVKMTVLGGEIVWRNGL